MKTNRERDAPAVGGSARPSTWWACLYCGDLNNTYRSKCTSCYLERILSTTAKLAIGGDSEPSETSEPSDVSAHQSAAASPTPPLEPPTALAFRKRSSCWRIMARILVWDQPPVGD